MKKHLPIIISLVFFAFVIVVSVFMHSMQTESLNEQQLKISSLENEIDVITRTQKKANEKAMSSAVGVDTTRVDADKKVISTFCKKVVSWSDYKSYRDLRNSLIKDYKIAGNSDFMTIFMPEYPEYVTSNNGTKYSMEEAYNKSTFKSSLSYSDATIYNTAVSGGKYSYVVFVNWVSRDKDKNTSNSATSMFSMDVDSDGNISNVHAYAQ